MHTTTKRPSWNAGTLVKMGSDVTSFLKVRRSSGSGPQVSYIIFNQSKMIKMIH